MKLACVAECPETMLGRLKACPEPNDKAAWLAEKNCRPPDDAGIVNGVRLPQHVVEELRLLGLPLTVYTRGELDAIIAACAFDAHLIDDPNGVNLWDKMTLTKREAMEDKGETDLDPWRGKPLHPLHAGFGDVLLKQRLDDDNSDDTHELSST